MIIFIFGLPGSGKTTVARRIAEEMDVSFISTEMVYATLVEEFHIEADRDFSEFELKILYNASLLILRYLIENNKDVVIEGVFRSFGQRRRVYELASEYNEKVISFYLQCAEEVLIKRLERRKKGVTPSPAGPETLPIIKKGFEEPRNGKNVIVINNDSDIENTVEIIKQHLPVCTTARKQ